MRTIATMTVPKISVESLIKGGELTISNLIRRTHEIYPATVSEDGGESIFLKALDIVEKGKKKSLRKYQMCLALMAAGLDPYASGSAKPSAGECFFNLMRRIKCMPPSRRTTYFVYYYTTLLKIMRGALWLTLYQPPVFKLPRTSEYASGLLRTAIYLEIQKIEAKPSFFSSDKANRLRAVMKTLDSSYAERGESENYASLKGLIDDPSSELCRALNQQRNFYIFRTSEAKSLTNVRNLLGYIDKAIHSEKSGLEPLYGSNSYLLDCLVFS